jgi:hypothetical protein
LTARARIAAEILDAIHDNVATKADLQLLKSELETRIGQLEHRLITLGIRALVVAVGHRARGDPLPAAQLNEQIVSGSGALGSLELAVRRAGQTASRSARVIELRDELGRGPGHGEQSWLVGVLLRAV